MMYSVKGFLRGGNVKDANIPCRALDYRKNYVGQSRQTQKEESGQKEEEKEGENQKKEADAPPEERYKVGDSQWRKLEGRRKSQRRRQANSAKFAR